MTRVDRRPNVPAVLFRAAAAELAAAKMTGASSSPTNATSPCSAGAEFGMTKGMLERELVNVDVAASGDRIAVVRGVLGELRRGPTGMGTVMLAGDTIERSRLGTADTSNTGGGARCPGVLKLSMFRKLTRRDSILPF